MWDGQEGRDRDSSVARLKRGRNIASKSKELSGRRTTALPSMTALSTGRAATASWMRVNAFE